MSSSIPVSAAKNVRTLKKATPAPTIGEDEDEADDERGMARQRFAAATSRSTSIAKENLGPGPSAAPSAKGKEKERRESWETLPALSRTSLGKPVSSMPLGKDLAPSRKTTRPAPTKDASLRLHPYHRPTHPASAPIPLPGPHIHLSKVSVSAADDYSPAGDESWETVESRRLSSLSLGNDTPTRQLLDLHNTEASLLLTSPPLLPTLPARADISYASPDQSSLRRALHQLAEATGGDSPGFATPVRRPAHLRPVRSGRDSASLEEMLKLSAARATPADEDDWLLCDEGVSVSMRNDMAGVTTPWRTSVAGGTLRRSQLGPQATFEDLHRSDERAKSFEALRRELVEANARADKAERGAEEQRDELARLHADEDALVEAARTRDAEVDRVQKALKVALREKLELEGEWDEERSRLEALARRPSSTVADAAPRRLDAQVELALVRAAAATARSVAECERLVEDAREEREAVRAHIHALRVLATGVGVWDSLVGGHSGA